jgi:hypothetical protein
MNWRSSCDWLAITVSPAQERAMDALEKRGLRFAVDFGYANAVPILGATEREEHESELSLFDRELAIYREHVEATQ